MPSRLDSLTSNLVRGGIKLFGFNDCNEFQYNLLTRKGKFLYKIKNYKNFIKNYKNSCIKIPMSTCRPGITLKKPNFLP